MTESTFSTWTELVDKHRQVQLTLAFLDSLINVRMEDTVVENRNEQSPLKIEVQSHLREDLLFAFVFFYHHYYGQRPLVVAREWRVNPQLPQSGVGDFVMSVGGHGTGHSLKHVVCEVKDCSVGGDNRQHVKRNHVRKQAVRYFNAYRLVYDPPMPVLGAVLFGREVWFGDSNDSNDWKILFSDCSIEFQFRYVLDNVRLVRQQIHDEYVTQSTTHDEAL
jgi:hypothetical protein